MSVVQTILVAAFVAASSLATMALATVAVLQERRKEGRGR